MADDRYRAVREVADFLKVANAPVRRRIREGELRAIDVGRGWRIAAGDLDAFLRGHATRPAEEPDRLASMHKEIDYTNGASAERKAKGLLC